MSIESRLKKLEKKLVTEKDIAQWAMGYAEREVQWEIEDRPHFKPYLMQWSPHMDSVK